ncbi:MAG: tetratricopeptide repeat protein [Patescibacteria group bacterium]
MPNSVDKLESDAINEALNKNWKRAVEINLQIVDFDKENIAALNRLAKAYNELEKYDDAKKILKTVLKLDPINQTAKKNMDLAENRKKQFGSSPLPNLNNFIKEPGATREFSLEILTKGLTAKKFYPGEALILNFDKHRVELQKASGELINMIDPQKTETLLDGLRRGATFSATFIGSPDNEKEITILINSSIPIFKGDKQDVKPYLKREIEGEEEDESTTEQESDETLPL